MTVAGADGDAGPRRLPDAPAGRHRGRASAGDDGRGSDPALAPGKEARPGRGAGGSIFQQHWWLAATTGNRIREVATEQDGRLVGRMPYFLRRRGGWLFCEMPPFTRTLGPVLPQDDPHGPPTMRREAILRDLVAQLPKVDVFRQVLDPDIRDGLAFQTGGFHLGVQYTLQLEAGRELEATWAGLRDKTRNAIRRSQERYGRPCGLPDSSAFTRFYLDNLRQRALASREDFGVFPDLYRACRVRGCGEIRAAFDAGGGPVAMAFFVWDDRRLYYLLSTRSPHADNGAVSLLVWDGILLAHERGLIFDFDGVSSAGRARFLSGFGASPSERLVVHKVRPAYRALRALKACLLPGRRNDDFD